MKGDRDAGMTLLELLLTMALMLAVVALVPPVIRAVSNASRTSVQISMETEAAQVALQSIDTQAQSAEDVCLPTQLTGAGFTLRMLQVVSTRSQSGTLVTTYRWMQWKLAGSTLYVETSASQTTTSNSQVAWASSKGNPLWLSLASAITNQPASPPFSLPTTSAGAPQEIQVSLSISSGTGPGASTVSVEGAYAALNTPYGSAGEMTACLNVSPQQ